MQQRTHFKRAKDFLSLSQPLKPRYKDFPTKQLQDDSLKDAES